MASSAATIRNTVIATRPTQMSCRSVAFGLM